MQNHPKVSLENLIPRLKKHEKLSLTVYPDVDKFAIGYGHQCKENHPPITQEQAEEYLRQDVYRASDKYMKWKAKYGLRLSQTRDEVLVEMIFWHGFKGFLKFKRMISYLRDGDYEMASNEMLDSDSGTKYFTRMYELSVLMREG